MKELPLLFSSLLCPNVRFIQWRIARGDVINQIYSFQWNDGDGISWLFVSEGRIQNLSQEDRQIHRITVNPAITVHNSSCGKVMFSQACVKVWKISLSFRLSFSLSDMTNYKSAFGKVCRIKNRHTFKSMPILNSAYFTECRRHIVIPCGKVCRIKNRHTFKVCRIKNRHTFKSMPILNSAYHAVKYAELRIGILLKVCRFVIRHITQTQTETQTEAVRSHVSRILSTGVVVYIPLGRHSPRQTTPSPETVTAADCTHPIGMHSCFFLFPEKL